MRLRVEAAADAGRIVSVNVLGPWSHPAAPTPSGPTGAAGVLRLFSLALWLSVLGASLALARHHIRANRADRRTAARLAMTCLLVNIAAWAVGGHHVTSILTLRQMVTYYYESQLIPKKAYVETMEYLERDQAQQALDSAS